MRRAYYVLDVFTETALAGNPLAVVVDGERLDAERMQRIAREFNLSETVFVTAPRDPANTARLRIFTPTMELPFAGHPTIGTAVLLGRLRAADMLKMQDVNIVLEATIGCIECTVRHRDGEAARARFALPVLPQRRDLEAPVAAIAAAVSLEAADIGFAGHQPSIYSAGVPFVFVPVASLAAIGRARPDPAHFEAVFAVDGSAKAFVYTDETIDMAHSFHARMFAPGAGIAEDPATGSAAAAFAGVLMQHEPPGDGDHRFVIEQGYEIGRPSQITLGLEVAGGILGAASIGGAAVVVAEGCVDL